MPHLVALYLLFTDKEAELQKSAKGQSKPLRIYNTRSHRCWLNMEHSFFQYFSLAGIPQSLPSFLWYLSATILPAYTQYK